MKKALALGLLLAGMLAFSHARANLIDLGITVGRDCVVNHLIDGPVLWADRPEAASSLPPCHVGLVFAVSPVKGLKLGLRGGYSTKTLANEFSSLESDYFPSWDEEINIYGGWGQFRILGEAPIADGLAFLYCGLGLGYYNYYLQREIIVYGYEEEKFYSESNTLGTAQTFIAGAHIGIVEWVGFNVEVDKLGWQSLRYEADLLDYGYRELGDIGKYEGTYEPVGGFGDIGISVALVFKI